MKLIIFILALIIAGDVVAQSVDVRVASGNDDAEERSTGSMYLNSTDLELVFDGSQQQTVGMRFVLNVPPGASIINAYVQFTVDERSPNTASLTIRGQAADHAAAFGSGKHNITSRALTGASVPWSPPPWPTVDASGPDQRTPDLSAILQEIVNRPGWQAGNAVAIIVSGTAGTHKARSYEKSATKAALLHVEYVDHEDLEPPTVSLTAPPAGQVSGNVTLSADASDDVGVAGVTFEWDSEPFGPADTQAPYAFMWDTTAFSNGFYLLTATATDFAGNSTTSDPVVVEVFNEEPPPPPPPPPAGVVRVPEDEPTIQAGIDAAGDGDTVLVSPGTYTGRAVISGKRVRLECVDNNTTVLDPGVKSGHIVTFTSSGAGSALVNCKVRRGDHPINIEGDQVSILNNNFEDTGKDTISVEGAWDAIISGNNIQKTADDCIDLDGPGGDTIVTNNVCVDPSDDGIEIRNFNDPEPATVLMEGNTIVGAGEDGIQIIDYSAVSGREFVIRRNLIRDSADAGIGFMDNGNTVEDFRAAAIPEPVDIVNNTLSGNRYGMTASGNAVILNNIIAGSSARGFKGAPEVLDFTLFWNNGTDGAPGLVGDPDFDVDFRLGPASAAIDAGTATYVHEGATVLSIPPEDYLGIAPDIGAFERE